MRLAGLLVSAWLLASGHAWPQSYEISWSTVDGGGSMNAAGGAYASDSTSGQPDAGGPFTGGAYALHSGFWARIAGGTVLQADLALSLADAPDPVSQGGGLTYTIQVTNLGPSPAAGVTVTDTLPSQVTFVSSTPGPPTCTHAGGTVTCNLPGSLAPAATSVVSVQVTVGGTALGTISNTAIASTTTPDPVPGNNVDTEPTQVLARAEGELSHGTRLHGDLAGLGGAADQDLFRILQEPYASYEIVLDATSGDIGSGLGPALDRVASDGSTVLQASQAVGVGHSRTLRFVNASPAPVAGQLIRVRSSACGSDCGADDVYRLRAWETTLSIPRFNNSATQVTVVILQDRGAEPIAGTILFWDAGGALLHQQPLGLVPRGSVVVLTSSIPVLAGQSGSITVIHDGGFDALAGKAVALEPATGYSFDSVARSRPR